MFAQSLLSYNRCVDNINVIKKIVTYHLRYSLLKTLSHKHKCSIKKILETYGKEIKTIGRNNKEVSFINLVEVTNIEKKFLIKEIEDPYETLFRTYINLRRVLAQQCVIQNCTFKENIKVYFIWKLYRNKDKFG